MNFIVDNWYIILVTVTLLVVCGISVYRYLHLPSKTQLAKVREWLLWAVTEAEKELGAGTGKLKLRQVYDLFVARFPWLVKVVSFDRFSSLVDDALDEMRDMLKTNQAVMALVNKEGDSNE